ncbi:MAG: ATP-dependent DNA helicase RecG [Acidimicrobiia bacterium]|nr:ATP-dependent DNA helicase RecG [Acidimicrobiia bacterium]
MAGETATARPPESRAQPRRLRSLRHVPVSRLSGVGPRRAAALGRLGIDSVYDLLWHVPRRYVDRTRQTPISELNGVNLEEGEELTIIAEVDRTSKRQIRRRLTLNEVVLSDGSGRLTAKWFNRPGLMRGVEAGATVAVSGKLARFRGRPQLEVSALEVVDAGRAGADTGVVVPIHAAAADVPPWLVRELMREALDRTGELLDPIPPHLTRRYGLLSRTDAFRMVHFPPDLASARRARDRLVYDELFLLETALAMRKVSLDASSFGRSNPPGGALWGELASRLPYELTSAQVRALREIGDDLATERPMHRLVQGDVGSGKTVLAAHALLAAVDAGAQGVLMAPTEVLAEQHHVNLRNVLDGLSVEADDNLLGTRPLAVEILTNRTTGAERERLLSAAAAGEVDILAGTHALIQEGVHLPNLGVAVVDEQHRFGVHQRVALRERGDPTTAVPDVLIMTATPIPRTLAMTLYGDLDVTVLDEMPPGRRPIETVWVAPADGDLGGVWAHVRAEVDAGRQAYVVCPLVSDSDQTEAASATATHEELATGVLAGLEVGLLHGQLRPAEKHDVMAAFRGGAIQVVVATTVIEVGVDVPNATVMVVLDADRFGLSQLHQLRGRIGRGSHASTCYLVADPTTPEGRARLEAMVETTDGFVLAERDLEIRGEGTVLGARQSGVSDLRVTRLVRDVEWVQRARTDAFALVETDPELEASPLALLREEVFDLVGDDVDWLLRS